MEWAQTAAGFLVGILVGLTGVGGGSLMTPLLIFVFGVSPVTAVGTDLLFAAITKAGGVISHAKQKTIHWRITLLLMAGSIPTALITIQFLGHLFSAGKQIDTLINIVLGGALILTSLVLLFRNKMNYAGRKAIISGHTLKRIRTPLTILSGVLLGVLVPVSSIGAGALGAAILMFLYPSLPTRRIVGTDLAHAVPLTAIAGLGHLQMGTVDVSLLLTLLLGSIPGIYLGSHMSNVIPEKIMRTILASLLMMIGFKFMLAS